MGLTKTFRDLLVKNSLSVEGRNGDELFNVDDDEVSSNRTVRFANSEIRPAAIEYWDGESLSDYQQYDSGDHFITSDDSYVMSGNNAYRATSIGSEGGIISQTKRSHRGVEYTWWAKTDGGSSRPLLILLSQSSSNRNNCYYFEMDGRFDRQNLNKVEEGNISNLARDSTTFTDSDWYFGRVRFEGKSQIRFTTFEQDMTQKNEQVVTDSTFQNGFVGFAFRDNAGSFDMFRENSL